MYYFTSNAFVRIKMPIRSKQISDQGSHIKTALEALEGNSRVDISSFKGGPIKEFKSILLSRIDVEEVATYYTIGRMYLDVGTYLIIGAAEIERTGTAGNFQATMRLVHENVERIGTSTFQVNNGLGTKANLELWSSYTFSVPGYLQLEGLVTSVSDTKINATDSDGNNISYLYALKLDDSIYDSSEYLDMEEPYDAPEGYNWKYVTDGYNSYYTDEQGNPYVILEEIE